MPRGSLGLVVPLRQLPRRNVSGPAGRRALVLELTSAIQKPRRTQPQCRHAQKFPVGDPPGLPGSTQPIPSEILERQPLDMQGRQNKELAQPPAGLLPEVDHQASSIQAVPAPAIHTEPVETADHPTVLAECTTRLAAATARDTIPIVFVAVPPEPEPTRPHAAPHCCRKEGTLGEACSDSTSEAVPSVISLQPPDPAPQSTCPLVLPLPLKPPLQSQLQQTCHILEACMDSFEETPTSPRQRATCRMQVQSRALGKVLADPTARLRASVESQGLQLQVIKPITRAYLLLLATHYRPHGLIPSPSSPNSRNLVCCIFHRNLAIPSR